MRKLEGEEIDWIDPEQKRRARKRQEMINRLGYDPDDVWRRKRRVQNT